jgi:hypothetical protein
LWLMFKVITRLDFSQQIWFIKLNQEARVTEWHLAPSLKPSKYLFETKLPWLPLTTWVARKQHPFGKSPAAWQMWEMLCHWFCLCQPAKHVQKEPTLEYTRHGFYMDYVYIQYFTVHIHIYK